MDLGINRRKAIVCASSQGLALRVLRRSRAKDADLHQRPR
jgi:hypothetical protein